MFGTRTTITVPVTIDGETHHVPTAGPRIPRDWDHIILTGATVATGAAVLAAIGWSVTGIGGLLSHAAPAPAAYTAAAVFDFGWIICLAMEWLARYDRSRARMPKTTGWCALAIAMAALATNGVLSGGWAVGIVAAAVSAIAKGMWHVVLRGYSRPLDPLTEGWVIAREAKSAARLATAASDRREARAEGLLAAQRRALPSRAVGQPDTKSGHVPDAVRAAADTLSTSSPITIATALAAAGIAVDADTVRAALSGQPLPRPDTKKPQQGALFTLDPNSISGLVREALESGADTESAVFAHVRAQRPDASADTVRRLYRRHRDAS